jgi:hypothetical protein
MAPVGRHILGSRKTGAPRDLPGKTVGADIPAVGSVDSAVIRNREAAIRRVAHRRGLRAGSVASTSIRVNTSVVQASTTAGHNGPLRASVRKNLLGAIGKVTSNFTPQGAILNGCPIETC